MTLKEARYEIQEKHNNEEDYYREFGEYSTDHSDKLQKALDLGVQVITEEEFKQMLERR